MVRQPRVRIEYTPEAVDHLRGLDARQRVTVLDRVEILLSHEPTKPTRNRKLLRANPLAPWELRLGDLRVYYECPTENLVVIKAVGIKRRATVRIGGEEIDL